MTLFNNSSYSSLSIFTLATLLAVAAMLIYRSELRRRKTSASLAWLLPTLRATAIWLVVVMLLEPTLVLRSVEGKPSQLVIAVDNSQSMLRTDGNRENRFTTAMKLLFAEGSTVLANLADQFNVQVVATNGVQDITLWSADTKSVSKPELPKLDELIPFSGSDDPNANIDSSFSTSSHLGNIIDDYSNAAVLLFSDGVTTEGKTILQATENRTPEQPPLFFVGVGADADQADAKIVSATVPEQLDQLDSLAGELQLDIDPDSPVTVSVYHEGQQIWSHMLSEEQRKQQKLLLSFPIKELVAKISQDATGLQNALFKEKSKLLNFSAKVEQSSDDHELRNNEITFQTWVELLRSKVLIVDSRPRWETRYIRNALDRDPAWSVTAISTQDREGIEKFLNISQDFDLFSEFDLVIMGELPDEALPEASQKTIERYVSQIGGGLILIDSNFENYQSSSMKVIADLLPIEYKPTGSNDAALDTLYQAALTESAKRQPAFILALSNNQSSGFDWNTLPPLYVQSSVQEKPSANVLLTGFDPATKSSVPIFVEMRVGAGNVFYSASDQTWKWRFKQADTIHRRLWAQICRSYARKPFLVQSDALAMDVSAEMFAADQSIPVRVQLNSESFTNDPNRLVYAILTNAATKTQQRYQLDRDANVPMLYRGVLPSQPFGQYNLTVETAGMTELQQSINAPVIVQGDTRREFLATYQDRVSMEQASAKTGGSYANPEEFDTLLKKLESISTGKIVRSNFAIWKSYWWFVPLVMILAIEWFLRKQGGLL